MNNYFQFKQFTIHQEKCAMKVTEIACIQGAWSPIPATAKRVLDIGTGTGLLTLMIAQRYPQLEIEGIEIDREGYFQSRENIEKSSFKDRIKLFEGNIETFIFDHLFDFIICNPPFFENSLKSENQQKNKAWHSTQLTLENLLITISKNLAENGQFSILLPYSRFIELESKTKTAGFYPINYLLIKHSEKHDWKYVVGIFGRENVNVSIDKLILKTESERSTKAVELFKPFYLNIN